jgi:hypothetical protein
MSCIAFLDFYDKPSLFVMLVNVSFSNLLFTSLPVYLLWKIFHYVGVKHHIIIDNASSPLDLTMTLILFNSSESHYDFSTNND